MAKLKKIKLFHSFPLNNPRVLEASELTFKNDIYNNYYSDNLANIEAVNDADAIFLHLLRNEDCLYLNKKNITKPIILFVWGAEFFNNGVFYNEFLLNNTKLFRRKIFFHLGFFKGLKQLVKEIMPWLTSLSKANRDILTSLKKIDFIIPVVPGDYYLLRNKYDFKAKLFHLNYVNPLVESDLLKNINGRNILLGNSSSYANNHFDAIDDLARIDLEDRKVIIPLSYGDTVLAEYIANYAVDKLGESKVIILKEFMSFSDYNNFILSCEIVIMNHKRQQAVGNIVQSLLNGAHIYLRRESTVYQYLQDSGFKISAFNNIKSLSGLSIEDVDLNRYLAKKVFGSQLQLQKIQSLINQAICE